MSIINISHAEITTFILVGMPGLEYAHIWISIPMCSMYLIALLGNCTILFIIKTEPSLHEPMYYFLSILTLSDMGLSFSSLPTMLRIFLFKASEISANAYFAQQFFIHGFTALESSVLLIMSFDCVLAIHNPLRYSSLLTTLRVPIPNWNCILFQELPPGSSLSLHFENVEILWETPIITFLLSPPGCREAGLLWQPDWCHLWLFWSTLPYGRLYAHCCVLHSNPQDCAWNCIPKGTAQGPQYLCFTHLCSDHLLSAHHQPCHCSSFCPACLSPLQCSYGKCSFTCASTDESHCVLCQNQAD